MRRDPEDRRCLRSAGSAFIRETLKRSKPAGAENGSPKTFWESHDPTQGMRQGNDHGTQYRSGIYTTSEEQKAEAIASKEAFGAQLKEAGFGAITTEILSAPEFFFAEDYHQQYLHKNPGGYCGLGGTGVSCPIGLFSKQEKYANQA